MISRVISQLGVTTLIVLGGPFGMGFGFDAPNGAITTGEFQKIYDLSVGEKQPWYINDHTFIQDKQKVWHMFGITHAEPADPGNEIHFAHATAKSLMQKFWHKEPFALSVSRTRGESHLWAPHVIENEGTYYMFYCGGDARDEHSHSRIQLALSHDLFHWKRHAANPMIVDGFDARDPYVLRLGSKWILYYTATSSPEGGHHVVAFRESDDLIHWKKSNLHGSVAFTHPSIGTWGGPTESPTVIEHQGLYYLFIGPSGANSEGPLGYSSTAVYVSKDPLQFEPRNLVTLIPAHAVEVVQDNDGQYYVSHAGWAQGGLYLAPLFFQKF